MIFEILGSNEIGLSLKGSVFILFLKIGFSFANLPAFVKIPCEIERLQSAEMSFTNRLTASLTPSGLEKRSQMAILSKIEIASKVSLKLTSRINLGRRSVSARRALCFGHWTQPTSPPTTLAQPGKG